MRPHVSGTERVDFSKQDARGNLVVASLPVNFPFSTFWQRFPLRTSVGLNTIHTFLMNRLIVACLMTASSCFTQGNSVGLPCYKILCSGILKVPLPYGMCLKVSHEGRHIFEQLHPQQHRSTMDETQDSQGRSVSIPFLQLSGSGAQSSPFMVLLLLCIVVRFWYYPCTWLPCRKRTQEPILHTRWVACEHRCLSTKKKGILGWGHLKSYPRT